MSKVMGTFGSTGSSAALPGDRNGALALTISGTFSATVNLQWSFDGGGVWVTVDTFTTSAQRRVDCPSDNVLYRLNCSAYTSGSVVYGLAT